MKIPAKGDAAGEAVVRTRYQSFPAWKDRGCRCWGVPGKPDEAVMWYPHSSQGPSGTLYHMQSRYETPPIADFKRLCLGEVRKALEELSHAAE
jgi:hypothetical protein